MVGKIEMVADWSVKLCCVDSGSMPIEASFECGLGFPYILNPTDSASDEIHNIGGGASNVALGGVGKIGRVAGESIALVNVQITYNTSAAGAFEGTMLYGRRVCIKRRDPSTDNEIFEVAGATVC